MHEPPDIDPEIDKKGLSSKKTKNKFTENEDNIIKKFVDEFGAHTWGRITPLLPGRTPRQVRERWVNYLSPAITHDPWTKEEDELIMKLVANFGKKWAYISRSFNQRTDVSIKNRYFLLQRREKNDIRKTLMSQLSKKKLNQLESQIKNNLPPTKSPTVKSPAISLPVINSNATIPISQEPDYQVFNNYPYQDVIEEQNFADISDSENYFEPNNLIDDFEYQFFL